MRSTILASLLMLPACTPAPQQDPPRAQTTPDGYRAAAASLDAAIAGKDRAALESLIAADLLWIRGSGAIGGKADFIAALTSDSLRIEPFTPSNPKWILDGNTALLAATNTLKGTADGEAFVDRHRFADHWIWRDGGWRLVYVQVTPVQDSDAAD